MPNKIKQVIGIDCSKDTLDCAYGALLADLIQQIQEPSRFNNDLTGINKLIDWMQKRQDKQLDIVFVVEATGVYHELLVNTLTDQGYKVSIVLPNRTSSFFRTTKIKTINDPSSAKMITQFGLEKQLDLWQKPREIYRQLKQLTRERSQLIDQRTITKNQLHAEQAGAHPLKNSIKRMKQLIKLLNAQIDDIENEIQQLLEADVELDRRIKNLCSVPGVGMITAVTAIAETSGFDLIRNKSQLVSYAGLDVIEKQSGISVHGKKHISHRGNKYLRKALYFPAFTAIKHNPIYKNHYAMLVSKHGIKMKAAVSVQRKMLVLIYALWKKDQPFDPDYSNKESGQQLLATPTELTQGRS
jgi:transposase